MMGVSTILQVCGYVFAWDAAGGSTLLSTVLTSISCVAWFVIAILHQHRLRVEERGEHDGHKED